MHRVDIVSTFPFTPAELALAATLGHTSARLLKKITGPPPTADRQVTIKRQTTVDYTIDSYESPMGPRSKRSTLLIKYPYQPRQPYGLAVIETMISHLFAEVYHAQRGPTLPDERMRYELYFRSLFPRAIPFTAALDLQMQRVALLTVAGMELVPIERLSLQAVQMGSTTGCCIVGVQYRNP